MKSSARRSVWKSLRPSRVSRAWAKVVLPKGVAMGVNPVAAALSRSRLGFVAQESEGNAFVAGDKLVGVTLRTYENEGHGLVPQMADAAPRSGEHVEIVGSAGAHQHPFLPDGSNDVFFRKA